VILAVLFDDESSDYILRVLQWAGIPTAFDITPEEEYRHKTRKRADQPASSFDDKQVLLQLRAVFRYIEALPSLVGTGVRYGCHQQPLFS
jgi:hypothetical protein